MFGCIAYVHIPSHLRNKLDPRAEKCVFVGYATNKKGYKCFNPITRKFHITMDVHFVENTIFFHKLLFKGREKMKISFGIFLLQHQIFLLMILFLLLGLNCLIEKK